MFKNENYNIIKLAEENNYYRFVYFRVTLRDKINYDIELIKSEVNTSICKNNKKNRIIYACQTKTRENQSVPPRYNSYFLTYKPYYELYSYETSTIDILLECSDVELKRVSSKLNSNNKETELLLYDLLEFFSYKYNIAVSGNDFIEPFELCVGSFVCYCIYKNKKTSEYEDLGAIIRPAVGIINNSVNNSLNFQKIVDEDVPVWKYFYNKTKFCFLSYRNMECIVNSSITFESYIIYLIKQKGLYNNYLLKYKKMLGFNSAITFAKDNGLITIGEYNDFVVAYEKVGKNRSEILHGIITTPIVDRGQAEKAYKELEKIFNKLI